MSADAPLPADAPSRDDEARPVDPAAAPPGSALPVAPTDRLAAAARALARSEDLDGVLDVLLRTAAADRAADVAVAIAVDDDRSSLHVVHVLGFSADALPAAQPTTADLGDPIVAAAVERQRVVTPLGDEPVAGGLARSLGLGRLVAEPLIVGRGGIDHAVGVLALGWRDASAAGQGTSGVLEAVADMAAVAIDRAKLSSGVAERSEWFERLAHIDPLTGLANRRTFDRVLELELARAGRQGGEVSVAIFDIDAFRATNATAGVTVGDHILRAVASVLADSVRLVDTVARIGGDEFIVVLPGSGGLAVARRVMRGIAELPEVGGVRVSVSAGVARFPADGTSADELVEAALVALGAAREVGTGSVALVPPGSTG